VRRARWRIGASLVVIVTVGLLSRRFPLPGVFEEHTGDALYATAAFCLFALLAPAAGGAWLAAVAFGFAAAIELSQLLTWPWLQQLRATRGGALLLGQGFVAADFPAYAIGALLGLCLDRIFLRGSTRGPSPLDRLPQSSPPGQ
jgi:hypothetical protein